MAGYFNQLDFGQQVNLLIIATMIIFAVLMCMLFVHIEEKIKKERERKARRLANSKLAKKTKPLSGKDVHMAMNIQYYDAILSSLTDSLKRYGYTLSSGATNESLLPAHVFEAVARKVDRARLDHMTAPHYSTCDEVAAHMKQGYAQVFLTQLIQSCAQLGWKVTPYISVAEDECENLSASLS